MSFHLIAVAMHSRFEHVRRHNTDRLCSPLMMTLQSAAFATPPDMYALVRRVVEDREASGLVYSKG